MQVNDGGTLEWNGDAYHRLSDVQFNVAMTLIDTLALKGDESLLDAGCGSGRITQVLLSRLPKGRVIGADLSQSMLRTARRECIAKPGQRVDFVVADLQTYVTPQPVDGIFSNMALHFVHDHAQMYRNFAACLQPEGFLALQFGHSQLHGELRDNLMHLMNEPPFGPYLHASAFNFRGCDPHNTRLFLQQAGFVNIEVSSL
ncbi:MAG: methyltransferase domain-containing protein, partial [Deltaproteobacteria bacterium]